MTDCKKAFVDTAPFLYLIKLSRGCQSSTVDVLEKMVATCPEPRKTQRIDYLNQIKNFGVRNYGGILQSKTVSLKRKYFMQR